VPVMPYSVLPCWRMAVTPASSPGVDRQASMSGCASPRRGAPSASRPRGPTHAPTPAATGRARRAPRSTARLRAPRNHCAAQARAVEREITVHERGHALVEILRFQRRQRLGVEVCAVRTAERRVRDDEVRRLGRTDALVREQVGERRHLRAARQPGRRNAGDGDVGEPLEPESELPPQAAAITASAAASATTITPRRLTARPTVTMRGLEPDSSPPCQDSSPTPSRGGNRSRKP